MKLSKLKAAHASRQIAGQTVPFRNTTSKAFAKAKGEAEGTQYAGSEIEGSVAKQRLDRARAYAHGGRIKKGKC